MSGTPNHGRLAAPRPAGPTQAQVTQVRAFNRFYTNVIGVLHSMYLDTPYTLTESRLLFEIARLGTVEVSALRQELDIDPGYLSRVLARFESDGLVTRHRSAADARRQEIRATEAGRAAGLNAELAERLARHTVIGSAALLDHSELDAATLRKNVTSPGGTTAAALEILGGPDGLKKLIVAAVAAATKRGRELAK